MPFIVSSFLSPIIECVCADARESDANVRGFDGRRVVDAIAGVEDLRAYTRHSPTALLRKICARAAPPTVQTR